MENLGVSSVQCLQALSALLSTAQEEDGDEEYEKVTPYAQLGPGHVGAPPKKDGGESTARARKNSNEIWCEEKVAEGSHYDDLADMRPQPEYEIILKQSVGTEDLFLGLSGKDPSSMCCEAMLVKIKLPDTKATDLVLDVKETFLDLRTPKYKLGLHLPHPVDSQGGKAQFYCERDELRVTLVIKRPMGSINKPQERVTTADKY